MRRKSRAFLRAVGLRDVFVDGPLDCQVVKQTLEWKGPARFGYLPSDGPTHRNRAWFWCTETAS
jgi:hypothetical protein